MKCKRVKMLLSGLLDQSVSDSLQKELFEHIKKCANCRKEYEGLNNLDVLLKMQMKKEPGEKYWSTYWDRLEKRFMEKTFKPKSPILKRLREIYLPFFPLPKLRLATVFATAIIFALASFTSFQLGKNISFTDIQMQKGNRLPAVLAKYENQGYPESVAKAMIAQGLIKDFFGSLAVLYTDEGLDEFVTYISKNGHRADISSPLSVTGMPKKEKKYNTTITIPDVQVGEKKVVIKAAAKHAL